MDISLGHSDLIRLFNVDDPHDFAPGLELCGNGVFVKSREGLPAIARGGEEEAVLTEHPTGNLSKPVLELPCDIEALESFMESYGLVGVIPVSSLVKVLKPKMWAQALADAKETGQYNGSILVKLSPILEKYKGQHETEGNDSKKVVLREVLDDLSVALADVDLPNLPSASDAKNQHCWPWGDYTTSLLGILREAVVRFYTQNFDPSDPDTWDTQATVSEWLRKQHPHLSERLADGMARIVHPNKP